MSLTVIMPQLGLTMTEGTVTEWLKKPGDTIKKDEPVFVVSTDKADMEVESMVEGTLREIIVQPGQTVPVGTVLGYLEAPQGNGSAAVSVESNAALVPPPAAIATSEPNTEPSGTAPAMGVTAEVEPEIRRRDFTASPRAKRLARQLGIDLARIKGSGAGGRIVEEDLQSAAPPARVEATYSGDAGVRRRQLIAERMVESVRTIPHFSLSLEVNAERLVALYLSLKEPVGRAAGTKLTYTDLLLKALSLALASTPEMNASWQEGDIRPRSAIDLGLAVATERGVVAPVLRGADGLPLDQFVKQRAQLAEKARQGRLALVDLEGGAGTLTNLGMHRVDRFEAIINPGQAFILAAGKLRDRPWVETSLVIKPTIIFTLSVDHRLADGVQAAIFLERIAETVENPYRILWTPAKT